MIPERVRSKLRRISYARALYWWLQIRYRKLNLPRQLRKGTPIIVFQMGKVGSTSIQNSLKESGVEPVFHVHVMNLSHSMYTRSTNRTPRKDWPKNRSPVDLAHIWLGQKLFCDIIRAGKRAKFITLVREPISRSISSFFFSLAIYNTSKYDVAKLTDTQLISIFIEKHDHGVPFRWFDEQLKPVLDIDIYKYPFPKEQGYLSIMEGNFELLILKLETDDVVKERALSEFLGVKNFKLNRSNVAQELHYAAEYAHFLEILELPEDYLEIMCNSQYSRHFYTDAEIEGTRLKWRSKVGKNKLPLAVKEELLRTSSRVF